MARWETLALCADCWPAYRLGSDRKATRVPDDRRGHGSDETCCACRKATNDGIYVRVDAELLDPVEPDHG